jgi:hypothetical protein
MRRILPIIGILLAVVVVSHIRGASGSDQPRTRLSLTVYYGNDQPRGHAQLTCDPAPTPSTSGVAHVCAALVDYLPREMTTHPVCSCGIYWHRVEVTGVVNGHHIGQPVEISGCAACGLGKRARDDVAAVARFFDLHGQL